MPAPNVEEVQVPCSLFLGLNTEVSPADLPEGVSPACADVAFVPGSVRQRPCLHKTFNAPFPAVAGKVPTVAYQKTFTQPNTDPLNLYMTSDGSFWTEDILNSPGAYTKLSQVISDLYAQSVTADGAEYIAFSDGLQGMDVPRQVYRTPDGVLRFDRISQDGPGAGPAVADFVASLPIQAIPPSLGLLITAATEANNIATITTLTAHNYYPGMSVLVLGVGVAGYNGIQTVATTPSADSYTYLLSVTGLGGSSGGRSRAALQFVQVDSAPQINPNDPIVITGTGSGLDNNVAGNPANWQVLGVTGPVFGLWDIWFSLATAPSTVTITPTGAVGNVQLGGQSSPGVHQCVVMFLTRSGYLTEPSPPISFVSAGDTQWQITNLPIGPPNVIARFLAFTGAGGDNFFTIPTTITLPNLAQGGVQIGFGTPQYFPATIPATVVLDNISTSAILDVSDNALFGALGIDIDGNDLFNQVVLGPCLGTFFYASRLFAWGMSNKIETLLNMGFEGGYQSGVFTTPLGWSTGGGSGGGFLINGPAGYGQAWQITGDGSATRRGQIVQGAYQNAHGIPILEPSTNYTFRCYLAASAGAIGTLFCQIFSPTSGQLGIASIPFSASAGGFVGDDFNLALPAVVPADTVINIYAVNIPNLETVTIDEMELVPTFDPFFSSFLVSYVDNFEAFDGVSGVMGPTSDPNPLRNCQTIRDQLQFLTTGGMHQTSDNGQEPATWQVSEISNDVGLAATRALDSGEECIVFVSKSGGGDGQNPTYALRIFEGGQPWKISQEVQSIFDAINPAAEQTMWLVNDIGQRRIYIGVPTGAATAPDQIYVLDYREIDTAAQIASSPSIHISFTGKMISSDLARKWTPWNIAANCGAMLSRSATNVQFCLGAGNGEALGVAPGFGNVYYLDPAKFTDDDYGAMTPFYTMYFFLSRDTETQLGVGSMRKLYKRVSEFVTGIGIWTVTPYAASLTNPWPSPPSVQLSLNPVEDIYHGLNVSTERMAVKYAVTPLAGTTDVAFNLQHMEATVMQHPMSPFGTGANL